MQQSSDCVLSTSLLLIDPILCATRQSTPACIQKCRLAIRIFGVALLDNSRRVDNRAHVPVAVLLNVKALLSRAVAVGIPVTEDHGIDIDRRPDVLLLCVTAYALLEDLPKSRVV